jgi:hypothetical protein
MVIAQSYLVISLAVFCVVLVRYGAGTLWFQRCLWNIHCVQQANENFEVNPRLYFLACAPVLSGSFFARLLKQRAKVVIRRTNAPAFVKNGPSGRCTSRIAVTTQDAWSTHSFLWSAEQSFTAVAGGRMRCWWRWSFTAVAAASDQHWHGFSRTAYSCLYEDCEWMLISHLPIFSMSGRRRQQPWLNTAAMRTERVRGSWGSCARCSFGPAVAWY